MRYTRVYKADGDYEDEHGKPCIVVSFEDCEINVALKTYEFDKGIMSRIGQPWLECDSEEEYAFKAGLMPV